MKRKKIFEKEVIEELINLGFSTLQIAQKLGLTSRQVVSYRNKNKIGAKSKFGKFELSEIEEQVVIGSLLGDGWIDISNKERQYCRLGFEHSMKQELYCLFKYDLLKRIGKEPKIRKRYDKRDNFSNISELITFKSLQHPLFLSYRNNWYNPTKQLCKKDFDKLGPLGLAIWYMDDGWNQKYGACISTQCFSNSDLQYMRDKLEERFGLTCTIRGNNVLYITSESKERFFSIIKEYVPNIMAYKIAPFKSDKLLENPEMDNQQPIISLND